MQGDQSRELADEEVALSEALGQHFGENCCGTLDFVGWIHDELCGEFDIEVINRCQFHCRKCYRIIQIDL